MKYNNIMKAVTMEYNERRASFMRYLLTEEGSLKRNLTPARLRKYEAGEMSRDDAVKAAFERGRKSYDNYEDGDIKKLEEAEKAADVVRVSVSVTWHKSRTWGYNPAAEIRIEDAAGHVKRYTGSASGCGYDKESAAIASALNQSSSINKMLYDCKEAAISAGRTYEEGSEQNTPFIHYGAGYGSVPYFEGGVGVTSHIGVFKACGLDLKVSNHTDYSDFYYFERV